MIPTLSPKCLDYPLTTSISGSQLPTITKLEVKVIYILKHKARTHRVVLLPQSRECKENAECQVFNADAF